MIEEPENTGDDEIDDPDGEDLCIHCLEPVGHNANFCIHCRAPLGFLAGTVPYFSVFAEGFIVRTAVRKPKNLLTVFGVWLIFGNYLLMGLWLSWSTFADSLFLTDDWTRYYFFAIYYGMAAIGLSGVFQGTRNYLRYRARVKDLVSSR